MPYETPICSEKIGLYQKEINFIDFWLSKKYPDNKPKKKKKLLYNHHDYCLEQLPQYSSRIQILNFMKIGAITYLLQIYHLLLNVITSQAKNLTRLFSNFFLSSLFFGLLVGGAYFLFTLFSLIQQQKSFQEIFTYAVLATTKNTIKFTLTYLVWSLAVALAINLSLLSGGLLPLGILLISNLMIIGHLLMDFIITKTPKLITAIRKTTGSKKLKLSHIKTWLMPELMGRSFWSLVTTTSARICGHLPGLLLKTMLFTGIGFFIGIAFTSITFLYYSLSLKMPIKKNFNKKKTKRKVTERLKKITPLAQKTELVKNKGFF